MNEPTTDVAILIRDNDALKTALALAAYDTLREHKLLGFPIVVWRDGKVVWVPPEEIVLPEQKNGAASESRGSS